MRLYEAVCPGMYRLIPPRTIAKYESVYGGISRDKSVYGRMSRYEADSGLLIANIRIY
jgi:hypothetical protein